MPDSSVSEGAERALQRLLAVAADSQQQPQAAAADVASGYSTKQEEAQQQLQLLQQQLQQQQAATQAADEEAARSKAIDIAELQRVRDLYSQQIGKLVKHHKHVLKCAETLWKDECDKEKTAMQQEQQLRKEAELRHVAEKQALQDTLRQAEAKLEQQRCASSKTYPVSELLFCCSSMLT